MPTEVMSEPRRQNRKLTEFKNEPLTDFSKPENKSAMEAALKKVRAEFGREYPLVIGGERIGGLKTFDSFNPAHKEQLLGKQMAKEIENQSRLITDPVITEYVNRIGQQLVRHSDARVPFTIKVVDSDEINAFALPGGYFYVNSGLILAAENEAELAGVMAHEIAHVAARHATKNATKSQIWNLVSLPMIFVGGPAGMILRQVAGVAVPMTFLKFSRDAEKEADLLGLEYQYAAGYDPAALVNFFEKLEVKDKKHGFIAKAFATHPMNHDRIKRAQQEIETMLPPRDEYVVSTSEFDEVKARLAQFLARKPVVIEPGGNKPILRRPENRD